MTLFSLRPLVTKTLKRYFSLKIDTIAFSNSQSIEEKLDIIAINQNSIINGVYSLDHRMDAMDKKVDDGFKAVNLRVDNLDKKVDKMDQRMDTMDKELKELRRNQKNFDKKLDNFGEMLKNSLGTLSKSFDLVCGKLLKNRFSLG